MQTTKSYLTSIIEFFLSLRAIISFTLLTLVFKVDEALLGGEDLPWIRFIYGIFLCILLIYFERYGSWHAPRTMFDSQYELEQESRTLWYKRFLLFYDLLLCTFVGLKIIYLERHYNFFNRTDAIILISILSILAIGKFLLNRPGESKNTTPPS